jgi:hypothetical protein
MRLRFTIREVKARRVSANPDVFRRPSCSLVLLDTPTGIPSVRLSQFEKLFQSASLPIFVLEGRGYFWQAFLARAELEVASQPR